MTAKNDHDAIPEILHKLAKVSRDGEVAALSRALLKLPRPTLARELMGAAKRVPKARPQLPIVLGFFADAKVPGLDDPLRELLLDKDKAVRGAAADLVHEYHFADRFVPELEKVIRTEAPNARALSSGLASALLALGEAGTKEARAALLRSAKLRFTNPWRRGNLLEALAKEPSPAVNGIFLATLKNPKSHPYEVIGAVSGLARAGDLTHLGRLRAVLDDRDLHLAQCAADALHDLAGTPRAMSRTALDRLAASWDGSPGTVEARILGKVGKKGGVAKAVKPAKTAKTLKTEKTVKTAKTARTAKTLKTAKTARTAKTAQSAVAKKR